ncbi:O-acetyltransferase OatA [Paraburkholderia sediminicola]|uniref:O-acetyltransferase OatA n=1 Tax=Paraburkholderia sediminicola TaxID=458836 RepID=A0A6J5B5Q2_9BURK|nr:acyltransferase [Paraburkholderia sediminicola]CAB3691502.1 O-acetyltransferase OatA [Paraburkholderia sediminicola]
MAAKITEATVETDSGKHYNNEIQALRAIAVMAVLVHHLVFLFTWEGARWNRIGHGLWVGVDLFFCISGYVIAKALLPRLEGKTGSAYWAEVGSFWVRRLYRITPSAWLWMMIAMAVSPFFSGYYSPHKNLPDVIAVAMHIENFHVVNCLNGDSACGNFGYYWTLSLEEQFYVLLPLLFLIFRKRLPIVLGIMVAAQFFIHRNQWDGLLSFIRTDAILLGVLLAFFSRTDAYRMLEPNLLASRFRFIIPSILFAALFAIPHYEIVSFFMGMSALVSALIVWMCSYDRGYFLGPTLLRRALVWIGERSFAIYLIHFPVYVYTREFWPKFEPAGTHIGANFTLRYALTATIVTLILADLNFRFVEEPLRKRGHIRAAQIAERAVRLTGQGE